MYFIIFIVTFIFGTIIGSFLNVVALRYKTGRGVSGRSMCFSCGKTLKPKELVPLFSFLVQGGKCTLCKTPMSFQYPIVEAITGFVFAFIALKTYYAGIFWFLAFCLVFSILIVIAIYDSKHKIIPDLLAFLFGLFSLIILLVRYDFDFQSIDFLLDFLAGPILFFLFFVIWLLSKGMWMGLGDAKLAVGIGFLLGISSGLSAIIVGIWIGAIWSVFLLLRDKISNGKKRKITMKAEIPLAPFLIAGTFLGFLFNLNLLSIGDFLTNIFR